MYKLILIDLDGTLLNDQRQVSEENIQIIQKAYKEKGVPSAIATGRGLYVAEYIGNVVGEGFKQYIIASNGSTIKDNKQDIYINKQYLNQEQIRKIIKIGKQNNLKFMMQTYINNVTDDTEIEKEKEIYDKMGEAFYVSQNLEKYMNEEIDRITVIATIAGDKEDITNAKQELENVEGIQTTNVCRHFIKNEQGSREYYYIDIMEKGASKANAIIKLADHLGIKKEEIIVIGDGGNDLPMFEVAGLKVAMGNAIEEIKKKADYITESNNESGVAKAISKFVLENRE